MLVVTLKEPYTDHEGFDIPAGVELYGEITTWPIMPGSLWFVFVGTKENGGTEDNMGMRFWDFENFAQYRADGKLTVRSIHESKP